MSALFHKTYLCIMKKYVTLIFALLSFIQASASDYSAHKGVWANNNAEAVITDSVCIVYFRADSTLQAILEIPSHGILHKTVFSPDGRVSFPTDAEPLNISETNGVLNICGMNLKKVEDIETTKPYEVPKCTTKFDVGRCLQEWRLGGRYYADDSLVYCEINTNRHMFVYMVNPQMTYLRAAATRNNNNGTLFFQNIRIMKNRNTGEYTMEIMPDNYNIALNDLEIDNSKFRPNSCTFCPDGGIYWSLISFTDERILLNGCGETYTINRPSSDSFVEWFKYKPYSENNGKTATNNIS